MKMVMMSSSQHNLYTLRMCTHSLYTSSVYEKTNGRTHPTLTIPIHTQDVYTSTLRRPPLSPYRFLTSLNKGPLLQTKQRKQPFISTPKINIEGK